MNKLSALKIILALLPALIFTQSWAWVTGKHYTLFALLVLWAAMVWFVLDYADKNKIIFKLLRALEIAFFLLPISAYAAVSILSSLMMRASSSEFERTGAAIGSAIGGTIVVVIALVIGLILGLITHIIAGSFQKKVDKNIKEEPGKNFFTQNKALTIFIGMIILVIIVDLTSKTFIK
ncbi:MAG: hypothetical protein NTW66_02890 [Candidatus Magasanikbacteria bacterium]|nr:hypothetical protein [Candidatus Magasanikbacteria bacterium]